jgi:hypothetical protein
VITRSVGTMACAYLFTCPGVIAAGFAARASAETIELTGRAVAFSIDHRSASALGLRLPALARWASQRPRSSETSQSPSDGAAARSSILEDGPVSRPLVVFARRLRSFGLLRSGAQPDAGCSSGSQSRALFGAVRNSAPPRAPFGVHSFDVRDPDIEKAADPV